MVLQEDILYGRLCVAGQPIASEPYSGSYTITPKVSAQTLDTQNKTLNEDLNIQAIPTYQVSNPKGITYIIGDI